MRKLSLLLLSLLFSVYFVANAQDEMESMEEEEDTGLSVSGSIDTYYRTTLNTDDNGPSSAPGTSFANGTGFNIGMTNLILGYDGEKSGFVADLVFGPRGDDAVFGALNSNGAPGNDAIVNQLYAYWNVNDMLTLTMGNFNTFLGYEVISPTGNFNYSTSYMFSYGPFSHTGLKADLSLSDQLSVMLSVMNPTDATTTASVNAATIGLQIGYETDNGGTWLNIQTGDQDGSDDEIGSPNNGSLFQIDLTTGYNLSDAFYLGLNATMSSVALPDGATGDNPSFLGAAIYAQYSVSEDFAVGIRTEYFSETAGGAGAIGTYDTNGDANVIDFTLSANYKVGDLTFIPEYRIDMYSEDNSVTSSGATAADASSLSSVALAAVYAF